MKALPDNKYFIYRLKEKEYLIYDPITGKTTLSGKPRPTGRLVRRQ
ncbi:MAG: hypothetical protein IPL49_18065 [Saprospirales bacterium]|nr:hypothetical protein [Saprospirales bacterium]